MFDPENIWDYVIAFILGAFAGFTKLLGKKDPRQFRRHIVAAEICVSGLAGFLAILLVRGGLTLLGMEYNGDLLGLICGVAGLGGTKFLAKLERKTEKITGMTEDKESK